MKTDIFKEDLDYVDTIANEGLYLEAVFADSELALNAIGTGRTSHRLTHALESNDIVAVEQDQGVIKKLVEYIRKFIERIMENVSKLFNSNKSKENAEFAKQYRGPSDTDYAKALRFYVTDLAKSDTDVAEKLKTIPALTHDASLADVEAQVEQVTGTKPTPESTKEIFKKTKLSSVMGRLGSNNTATLNCMFTKEFSGQFQKALTLAESITSKRVYNDTLDEHASVWDSVLTLVTGCTTAIAENDSRTANVEAWVLGESTPIANMALDYIGIDVTVLYTNQYLKNFNVLLKELSSENSEQTVEKLKLAQSTLVKLTGFLSLASKVNKAYDSAITALRGM